MEKILKAIKNIKKLGLYPDTPIVNSPHEPEIIVNKKKMLMFASNNYLGMLTDDRVKAAAIEGIKKWGIGTGSARLLTGNLEIHVELEKQIAKFKHKDAALSFVAGYMVNDGCIPAIVNVPNVSFLSFLSIQKDSDETVVFSDEYNHYSIIAGIKLSDAKKEIFKHNDCDNLEERLKKYSLKTRKLIVTDGVFSMEGDIANLPRIIELAKKYKAMLYVDDAHATGILGINGRGTEDYFGVEGQVDFTMGTFTKCFGGVGGYITAKQEVIDYLKIISKSSIFTAPIAPPVAAGLIESIKIVEKEDWRRKKVLENAEYLRNSLKNLGFNTLNSETQIIPLLIGSEVKAQKMGKYLLDQGIFIPVARWPAVPKGSARMRMALMCTHTKEQIDHLIDVLKKADKKFKIT